MSSTSFLLFSAVVKLEHASNAQGVKMAISFIMREREREITVVF